MQRVGVRGEDEVVLQRRAAVVRECRIKRLGEHRVGARIRVRAEACRDVRAVDHRILRVFYVYRVRACCGVARHVGRRPDHYCLTQVKHRSCKAACAVVVVHQRQHRTVIRRDWVKACTRHCEGAYTCVCSAHWLDVRAVKHWQFIVLYRDACYTDQVIACCIIDAVAQLRDAFVERLTRCAVDAAACGSACQYPFDVW